MAAVIVYHSVGCDTGCCGHRVSIDGKEGGFRFSHPWRDDHRTFAEKLVRDLLGEEHVADLDWDHCEIVDD
jgi:hypothetical protein